MSQTQNAPQISGAMFLYERPELLNIEAHGALGIAAPAKPFGFAAGVKAIPLTMSEVTVACKDYPVIFMSKEEPIPVAVVGLIDDLNLFVDDEGRWEGQAYIPAYVRRYPFGVAAETGGDRMVVVIDRGYAGLNAGMGDPLFESGEPTAFTRNAIEFTKQYEDERQLTRRAAEELRKLDIIEGQTAQYTPVGQTEPRTFAQYFGVDEERLKNLGDADFLRLRQMGALPIIYAQLISMGNWRKLMARRALRFNLNDETAVEPLNRA